MTRATTKGHRARQYVFDGVSKESLVAFKREIRTMRLHETRLERLAREAASERARTAAGVYAAAIVAATKARHAEEDGLAAMEIELEELLQRKKHLFEDLKRSLEANRTQPRRLRRTSPSETNRSDTPTLTGATASEAATGQPENVETDTKHPVSKTGHSE